MVALDEEARHLMAARQIDADGDDAVGGLQRVELGFERPGLIGIGRGARRGQTFFHRRHEIALQTVGEELLEGR